MDAQGAESDILRGAARLLGQAHARVLMEVWPFGIRGLGGTVSGLVDAVRSPHGFSAWAMEKSRELAPIDGGRHRGARRRARHVVVVQPAMGEVARASRLRSALERLGAALDPGREREREQVRALLKHLRELRVENERRADAVAARLDAIDHAADALRQDTAASRRTLERTRQDALRQRGLVNRLLRRSGVDQRSAEIEERVTARMARIARSRLPVIVGPWTGEVGFELLYWIPFLQWVRETFPDRSGAADRDLARRRRVVVRGRGERLRGHLHGRNARGVPRRHRGRARSSSASAPSTGASCSA